MVSIVKLGKKAGIRSKMGEKLEFGLVGICDGCVILWDTELRLVVVVVVYILLFFLYLFQNSKIPSVF